MKNQQLEEKYWQEFYKSINEFAEKMNNPLEKEDKSVQEFEILIKTVGFIAETKEIKESEYLCWVAHCYINRKLDKKVNDWTFLETLRYTVKFDMDLLKEEKFGKFIN